MSRKNPSGEAIDYAKQVVAGKIPACKWVILACTRFLKDLKRQNTDAFPYRFDQASADKFVRFAERMPHVKGEWAKQGKTITYEPWQCFIDCNLFGWVHSRTGYRRFRESFELIPRKNAKSTRVAIRGIYLTFLDKESGAEVYCGATTEKQAFEVYRPAWQMVNESPKMKDHFTITLAGNPKNPGTMYRPGDMSKFETVIGNPGDGASPHGAIVDEYHEHQSDSLVATMQTGMGARRQPLLSIISTAGSTLNGPCHEKQKEIERILEGSVVDETIFGIIFTIDKEDQWDDPASLIKANPNYGVSVFQEFLLAQLGQAKRSAAKQNSFRTKHLNEWVGAKSAWMNMLNWNRQRMDKALKMEDFKAYPCRVAADLSSKKDVSVVDVTFEVPKDGVKHYYSFKKFFVPEEQLAENDKYMEFHLGGFLETTDGAMIDQERIEQYIYEDIAKNYKVLDVAFDEWDASYIMTRLQKLKIEVIKFPFRVKYVSEPMKQIDALVLDGKYWHDGNPVMTWMVGNVAAKEDIRGNIFPNKDRPSDPRCKIDGVAAAIMSMGRWMAEEEPVKEFKMFFV